MASINVSGDDFQFKPKSRQKIFQIKGRVRNPVLRMIMETLNIDSTVTFTVTRQNIRYRFSDLGGQTTLMSPLDSINSLMGSYERPKWALFLGTVLALGGVFGLFSNGGANATIAAIVGIGLIAYFMLTKSLYIGFSTSDFVETKGLFFVGTKSDGTTLTEEDVLTVVEHINVLLARARKSGGSRQPAPVAYEDDLVTKPKRTEANVLQKTEPESLLSDEDLRAFGILDEMEESANGADIDAQETASAIEAVQEDEMDIDALYEEAETAFASQDFEEAVVAANQILDDDAHHLDALKLRARAYHRLGNTNQAEADKAEWKRIYSAK